MKKKRRKKKYGVLVFFFVLFFGGGIAFYVYGQTDTTDTATNVVTIGNVDVELTMETHDAGEITPQDKIDNIVSVKNIGNYPAYIRMFVKKHWEITEGGKELTQGEIAEKYPELSINAIDIQLEDGWTKGESSSLYDGYECYYYNNPVPGAKARWNVTQFSDSYELKTEEITGDGGLTNELLTTFTKNGAKVYGYYEVIVEAIQADTCIPVTTEVEVEEKVEKRITDWNDIPDTSAPMPTVSINPVATPAGVVNFNSENAEIDNADSFVKIDHLVPGKMDGRVVGIKNTFSKTLPVYVYAESAEPYDELTVDQKEWLEQLQLIVSKENGTILYQDSLYKHNSDKPMLSKENPIKIDDLDPNESQNLYVAVYCPASWTKGDIEVKVNWIFASKKALPSKTQKPSGGGGGPVITITDAPIVTEEPVMETEVPEDTPLATAILEVTDTPVVTQMPSESPWETMVVVTDSPVWEGKETMTPDTQVPITQPPDTQPPESEMPAVTDDNVIVPEPTSDTGGLVSEEPNTHEPSYSPKVIHPSDDVPKKTSTPKQPTKVEELYPTKTGDVTPIVVWLVLFVVSCIGIISVAIVWRKSP